MRDILSFISFFILTAFLILNEITPASASNEAPKFVYVLVDYSMSTLPKTGNDPYRATLDSVVRQLGPGDRILVTKITDRSMTNYEIIAEQSFPVFNIFSDAKMKFDKKMKDLMLELNCAIDKAFNERRLRGTRKTDLMSSLILTGNYFAGTSDKTKKILLILSDMLEDSEAYNFEHISLSNKTIKAIIAKEKSANRLPKLVNVEVYVSGVRAKTTQKMLEVKKFWFNYFKETGANLDESHYLPMLMNIKIREQQNSKWFVPCSGNSNKGN